MNFTIKTLFSQPATWICGIIFFLCAAYLAYMGSHKNEGHSAMESAYALIFNAGFSLCLISNISLFLFSIKRGKFLEVLFISSCFFSLLINSQFISFSYFKEVWIGPEPFIEFFPFLPSLTNIIMIAIYAFKLKH